MSSVQFSGLASGIDTGSIVDSLMEIESASLYTMQSEQEYLEYKLDAYSEFNSLLEGFYELTSELTDDDALHSLDVTNQGSSYFSVTTSTLTNEGTYSVEVIDLAQQQKDITNEYIEDADTTMLSGELQIGDETYSYENLTLGEIVDEINDGDYGVTAVISDDGTESGYKMILTANTAGEEVDIIGTGDITIDTTANGHTVEGSQAHVIVDGVDYYSSSNTMTNAIKGTTLTLLDTSDEDGANNVYIESDEEEVIATKLQELVDAYNSINTFVTTIDAADSTLATSMETIQRNLKSKMSNYQLVEMGITSDWETGELSFDSDTLSELYEEDPDAVVTALLGDDDTDGIIATIDSYLADQVDEETGIYAVKEDSIEDSIDRLDDDIESMETRLEKRRETLESQFAAMEEIVSGLNTQASYLTSFFSTYNTSS